MFALQLIVQGEAQGQQAAVNPFDFVRLQEMQAGFSGTAAKHHTHPYTDILYFSSGVLSVLAANGFTPGEPFTLQPNGGLLDGPGGIYVDSGIVSFVGHKHSSSDITDFGAAVRASMSQDLIDSASVSWALLSSGVQASVVLDPTGGLLVDANGLECNFGTGHDQVARGDHTHSQLHNPLTLNMGTSLALVLTNQVLSGDVACSPLGGLFVGPSGVQVNFGYGPGQVMPGDTALGSGTALTVVSTASLQLNLNPITDILSGVVRLDPSPPMGGGLLQQTSNGLSVVLGTTADTAAAGNHTHAIVNSGTAGFMSPALLAELNALNIAGGNYLPLIGGTMEGPIDMLENMFFASGSGVYTNGVQVVGFRQAAPALFTDNIVGMISNVLNALPNMSSSDSGVQLLRNDINNNLIPALRNAISSLAYKQGQLILALKTFGCIG